MEADARKTHSGRIARLIVVLVAMIVPCVLAVPAAFAGVGLAVAPTFPASVTVGASGLAASIQVTNISTPPESGGTVTINQLNLVPACGTIAFVGNDDCPAASADPGVFVLSPTGIGALGTACANQNFNITIINPATGQVTFTPVGPPIVLDALGGNQLHVHHQLLL